MIKKILAIFFCVISLPCLVKANFDFNSNCSNAYQAIYDLRLDEAKILIKKEKQQNPNNGITILLDNYIDYFSIILSENKDDYERLKNNKNIRLSQLEKQDKNSPYYLYTQAEVNLQWGLVKGRFMDFFASGMDVKKADNLIKSNIKKYPNFLPNKKVDGLIDVILGSLPSNIKGVLQTFGFNGNAVKGINTMESLVNDLPKSAYSYYMDEVVFFICYIHTDLIHDEANYEDLIALTHKIGNGSLLKSYLQGYVALKCGKNDIAINYLLKSPKSDRYADFDKINYMIGNAKLNRSDADAYVYLIRYLKDYKGAFYVKDAYLKLAYYYYLRNDDSRYQSFLRMVKTQGNTIDEKDKQALKEANDPAPNKTLLKARLYFDGAYHSKALAQLQNNDVNDFDLKRDKIEFFYRLGRIYDELGKNDSAINNYKNAIIYGKETSYYFASNAALKIGEIYENFKDRSHAADYYKLAISMKNHEYENSIESQAKDGLKRLGY